MWAAVSSVCYVCQVLDGSVVQKFFYDSSAFFEDRSYMIPPHRSEGILVSPTELTTSLK